MDVVMAIYVVGLVAVVVMCKGMLGEYPNAGALFAWPILAAALLTMITYWSAAVVLSKEV